MKLGEHVGQETSFTLTRNPAFKPLHGCNVVEHINVTSTNEYTHREACISVIKVKVIPVIGRGGS
jgi:hypothetical protein